MNTQDDRYERARKRVREIKDFYTHLTVYVIVNIGLFAIDSLTPGEAWFYWPLMGWGIGVVAHWASLFGPQRRFGAAWEERKIAELMGEEPPRG